MLASASGSNSERRNPQSPSNHFTSFDWGAFENRLRFETADFLYRKNQMSQGDIDTLLKLWLASLAPHGEQAPFLGHQDLLDVIDATETAEIPWQSFSVEYTGPEPEGPTPAWMEAEYEVWYRDAQDLVKEMIANPDFAEEFEYAPYHEYKDGIHRYQNFMSGDWAWKQAVRTSFSWI